MPGLGILIITSITCRGVLIIQGVILFVTSTYVLVNLAMDILYDSADPRVQLGSKQGRRRS